MEGNKIEIVPSLGKMEVKMNKDKQEDKVNLRQAISVILSINAGLDVPIYKARDLKENETLEDVLMEQMLLMIRAAKKDVRKKRIRMFFIGQFFIQSKLRSVIKKQLKKENQACRYLLKHKKELRQYMSVVKLGIMDPKSTWLNSCYNCGDNVHCRINKHGVIEKNITPWADPDYKNAQCIYVNRCEVYAKTELPKEDDFESLNEKAMVVAQEIALDMANSTEPYKGISAFSCAFKDRVDARLREMCIEIQSSTEWIQSLNMLMDQTWKKRLECTENLKNSSTQKDDGLQS